MTPSFPSRRAPECLRGIRPGRRAPLRGLRAAVARLCADREPVRPRVRRFGAGQRRQWPLLRTGAGSWLGDRSARAKDVRLTRRRLRSEEHTSELQSLMRISYAVFCLKKNTHLKTPYHT